MVKCCFCKKDAGKYGNNALPIMKGKCCDNCDEEIVLPIRILRASHSPLLNVLKESREAISKLREAQK